MSIRETLRDEWRTLRDDPRKLALLSLLGVIVALQLLLVAGDWNSNQWTNLATLKNDRRRAEAVAEAARNVEFAQQAATSVEQAKSWTFNGPTFAIARLNAQQAVSAVANESGLMGVTVRPAADIVGDTAIRFTAMTVEGAFEWAAFLDFLDGLSALKEGVIVEYFAVSPGRAKQFRVVLRTPIAIGDAAEVAG